MRKSYHYLFIICTAIALTASKPDKNYYNETYRPQYHFSPEKHFQGEPGGLIFLDGTFHMFYQHNPQGSEQEYLHWGHAVSNDLLHWEHLPIAMTPDEDSNDKELCTIYPGSVLIDEQNQLGKQQNDNKTLIAFYTSKYCGQRMAYSNDNGNTWTKFNGNPVIPYAKDEDARDPKVFWHQPSESYVMVLYRKTSEDDKTKGVSFYNSKDLVNWEHKSHIYGFSERPDLVFMQVSNRPEEKKWVLFDGDGSYLVGNFDGETFTPESAKMRSDFGRNYFGTHTWSNIPEENNRHIQIAWMRGGKYPEMPFNGQMTFPTELKLIRHNSGYMITRSPVKEVEQLHAKQYSWENKNLIPGINQNIVKSIKGDCLHIIGEFDLKSCSNFGFYVRTGRKSNGTEILYDVKRGTLSVMGISAPLEPVGNKISLDILIDRSSIEVYANNGQTVITNNFTPEKGAEGLTLFCTGGEVIVDKLDIFKMNSVWR